MAYSDKKLKRLYLLSKKFLIQKMNCDDAENILQTYLEMPDKSKKSTDISEIYLRILVPAQNANSKANVIGGSIDGVHNLSIVLFEFNPKKVLDFYSQNHEKLLADIIKKLKPRGTINKKSDGLWVRYAKTILSAAEFLSQFDDGKDFYKWANHFYQDTKSAAALPLILEQEIYGIGYALACDFLKELGFINYGKPDVHIKDIFVGVGLCNGNFSNYAIQKIIVQIAHANQVSAYNVDKLFWLIGSGKFYSHDLSIGSHKDELIELANNTLNKK